MNDNQRWRDSHEWETDDPIGVVYSDKRHRWAHSWSEYLVIMIGLFGVIALLGAVNPFSATRMAGALGILAASFAISRSDRAHRTSTRNELIWAGVCVALAFGGTFVFLYSW